MPKREYDPLALIPSAETIRQKLARIQEQARKLNRTCIGIGGSFRG